MAQIVEVIYTNNEQRGKGVEDDPIRRVPQLWTLSGILICEQDEFAKAHKKPLIDLALLRRDV